MLKSTFVQFFFYSRSKSTYVLKVSANVPAEKHSAGIANFEKGVSCSVVGMFGFFLLVRLRSGVGVEIRIQAARIPNMRLCFHDGRNS